MKKPWTRIVIVIVAVIVVVAGVLIYMGNVNGTNEAGGQEAPVMAEGGAQTGEGGGSGAPQGGFPAGAAAQGAAIDTVRASYPETGDLYVTTGLTGTLESSDEVYIYAKAGGDVTAVNIQAGDTVSAGDVLFSIDIEQVASAKNSLDSAQLSLTEAQNNLNRMQILYDNGYLSDQEYEQYRSQVSSAQIQYNSAKLSYDQQVGYSSVTSPISGTVQTVDVNVYDRVTSNTELCVITGSGDKKITFYVTQRMLDNMAIGDPVTVVKSGKEYDAYVTEIDTMVDSSTGLFKVEAYMDNTEAIAIGSTVKLNVITQKAENAMIIPIDAVYYSGGEAYVYLYEDGKARTRTVEIGITDTEYAEVLSGLSHDDFVITTWSNNLYEGADVQLRED